MAAATAACQAPVGVIDLEALSHNARELVLRAGGTPIRVASKSVRVRAVLDAVLRLPGYRGVLAFTLPEALWLSRDHDDVVLGYPSVDRAALRSLAGDERAARRVTLMVDDPSQLDLIDAIAPHGRRERLRVAIDVDASWRGMGHVGVRRSPLHDPAQVAALAREIVARPGFRLVGLQMYEAQLAGLPDRTGAPADLAVRWLKERSRRELAVRRAAVVREVSGIAELDFVNGGGTGSLESTSAEAAVTEVTAGSGLLGGHLFDHYRGFDVAPAAAIGFDVVRRPSADIVTVLGGGWIASGPAEASRQPLPVWPQGLRTVPTEAAGEVQTPLRGAAARWLRPGERVWFRHAKSGEAAERLAGYALVHGDSVVDELPTYRGEGKAFL